MTVAERLQPAIVAAHRGIIQPLDTELLAYAKAEISRLRDTTGERILAEHDYESKIRCLALEKLVQAQA